MTLNQIAVPARTVPRITQLRAAALFRFIAGFAIITLPRIFIAN
jgi:hypothetical protein